ncbi:MAG: segregation/condensation protein A [Candidatus Gastranaerophilaceae bacterium]
MINEAALNYNIDLPDLGLAEGAKSKSEGIGILVDMAKAGKIDPWNIDIVDVTDKYLAHICEMKSQNLRLTGRTFLFAAVLLKLKSNVLEGLDVMQFESYDPADDLQYDDDGFIVDYGEDDYVPTNNVISIDEVLQRRTSVRLNHNRVVTLKDLIRQLEFYEKLEQKQSLKSAHERAKRRVQSYSRLSADDIVNLAHEEYIETCVLKLKENLAQIFTKNEKIELNELTLLGMDKISAYIALLFLTAETDYDLKQDEFYSDLYVVKYEKDEDLTDEYRTVEV